MLYGALFAAFGAASPFLPALLLQHGLHPEAIGIVLAAGTAIRLLAGPFGGRLADRSGRAPIVLSGFTAAAAVVATGYAPARGLLPLLLVSVAHAAVLAPLTPLADALTLGSSRGKPGFEYGWVRAAGSAAFIGGTLLSGRLVGWHGLGVIVWLNAGLLAAAACLGWLLPNRMAGLDAAAAPRRGSIRDLLALPGFVPLMIVVALIGGSHAMHDGFEVIRWRTAGLSAGQCSVLWALSVASEVAVFLLFGRSLLERLGPSRAMMLAAVAGIVRWGTAAQTARFPVMALVEPLHGLTFALLHLACLGLIERAVPPTARATALTLYGTVGLGLAGAAATLASGPLYAHLGAGAFWGMAALCLLALPLARGIRLPGPAYGAVAAAG